MFKNLRNGLIGPITGKNDKGVANTFTTNDMRFAQGIGAAVGSVITFVVTKGRLPFTTGA